VKHVINNQVVLSQPPEGPLAAHLVSFAKLVSEQGYCLYSLKRQVRIAACFSRWLKRTGVDVRSISSGHAIQYLRLY
jgi:integrase/recombinase XerD